MILIIGACDEEEPLMTEGAITGGLITPLKPSLNYVVGDGATYTVELQVEQGHVKITSVDVFKSFISGDETSNEVLVTTFNVSETSTHRVSFTQDYSQLISDLTLDGSSLPASDADLSIGDKWKFKFISTTDNGNTYETAMQVSLAVSTRFAGTYTVMESSYVHPTLGDQGGWNGEEMAIESVDATTYHILANGPFTLGDDPDNEFYFTVDENDLITIPKEYDGEVQTVWDGNDEVANCYDNPDLLSDVNCGNTDFIVRKDDGRDIITMSHGYIRTSGTRQFYYVLQKKL